MPCVSTCLADCPPQVTGVSSIEDTDVARGAAEATRRVDAVLAGCTVTFVPRSMVSAAPGIHAVPPMIVSAACGIEGAGAVIAFAAAALQRALAVGIMRADREVAVAADAFVNSLLVKRVAVITLATPALADAALRVGDAARGGTSSAPIGIASARSDIDPVRAGIHPVATMIARARTAIEGVPIGTSRAVVHMSRARARHPAALAVARPMR